MAAFSVATDLSSLRAQREMASAMRVHGKRLQELSAGTRLLSPSDDPAAQMIVMSLRAQVAEAKQLISNVGDGISISSSMDAGLAAIGDILTRMAELAEYAANGVWQNNQRRCMNLEVQNLASEIDRIAAVTTFNGRHLLSGTQLITIQVGFDSLSTSQISFASADGTLKALGLTDGDKFKHSLCGATTEESLNLARSLLSDATAALEGLSASRGMIGAAQNRLSSAVDTLAATRTELEGAAGRISDPDVAESAAAAAAAGIREQIGANVLGHLQTNSRLMLALL